MSVDSESGANPFCGKKLGKAKSYYKLPYNQ